MFSYLSILDAVFQSAGVGDESFCVTPHGGLYTTHRVVVVFATGLVSCRPITMLCTSSCSPALDTTTCSLRVSEAYVMGAWASKSVGVVGSMAEERACALRRSCVFCTL